MHKLNKPKYAKKKLKKWNLKQYANNMQTICSSPKSMSLSCLLCIYIQKYEKYPK